jgi:hypothetical protein
MCVIHYSFDTSNGIRVSDNTQILAGTPNPENPSELWNKIAKSGFYEYTVSLKLRRVV